MILNSYNDALSLLYNKLVQYQLYLQSNDDQFSVISLLYSRISDQVDSGLIQWDHVSLGNICSTWVYIRCDVRALGGGLGNIYGVSIYGILTD